MSIELLTHLKEERQKLSHALSGLGADRQGSVSDTLAALSARFSALASEIDAVVRGKSGGGASASTPAPSHHAPEKLQAEFNREWEDLFEVLLDLPPAMWQRPEIAGPVKALTDEIRAKRETIEAAKKSSAP